MSENYGEFGGKIVFGSTQAGVGPYYLTTQKFKGDITEEHPLAPLGDRIHSSGLFLPTMSALAATENERCMFYAQSGGGYYMQMASLLWVTLDTSLGWLLLTEDFSEAVIIELSGVPFASTMQVRTADGPKTVYYMVDNPSPILTINSSSNASTVFAPQVATPSLGTMQNSKNGKGVDLLNVNLSDQSMAGIDFTGADFTQADLTTSALDGTMLTSAVFAQAVLTGFTCDGAILDQAKFNNAIMEGVKWGMPKSAVQIDFTGCKAKGAILGNADTELDCTQAILTSGDFRGADLTKMNFTSAQAGSALLAGAVLNNVKLDGANLREVVAVGASIKNASLTSINGQSANFVNADLSGTDFSQAKMGAKAFLFNLPGSFANELDTVKYPQTDLIKAFTDKGAKLGEESLIVIVEQKARWTIDDPNGPYALILNRAGTIDVFLDSIDLRPANLSGARCLGTRAPGANMAGANLRGVAWYASNATLDHADLEGAALNGSLLTGTDFTQAFLSGADFSDCILIQSTMRGCLIGLGQNKQSTSFDRAQLQGLELTASTLIGGSLVGAAVALKEGVPLFNLPLDDQDKLVQARLQELAPTFDAAGYPLGPQAIVKKIDDWLIDNQKDTNPAMPRSYLVMRTLDQQLSVFDGSSNKYLFPLPGNDDRFLNRPTASKQLIGAFKQNGYSLAEEAPITAQHYWQIDIGEGGPTNRLVIYSTLRVYVTGNNLTVFGAIVAQVERWAKEFPNGLAFSATQAAETAFNASTIGPSGVPKRLIAEGYLTWQEYLTVDGDEIF